nr:MAG TPA: hypothetical protein [Caudoviricetes sp.]
MQTCQVPPYFYRNSITPLRKNGNIFPNLISEKQNFIVDFGKTETYYIDIKSERRKQQ